MATQYSFGKIVTDGLVLCLDAADRNSYVSGSTTWRDVAGSNNGTLTNGPTFNTGSGGNIVFDGVDDYVEIGDVASLDQTFTNITISTWLKPSLVSSEKAIMGKMGSAGNRGFQFILNSGNTVYMSYFSSPSGSETILNTPSPLVTSSFSNVAFVFNGGISHTFYLNGTSVSSSTVSIPATFNGFNNVSFRLADRGDGVVAKYTGSIALTQIYNRALTASEVLQNYNAQKSRFGLT